MFMKKSLSAVLGVFIFGSTSISVCAMDTQIKSYVLTSSNSGNSSAELRAEVIVWRYKVENGILYRRQFNQTTGEWLGSWEMCP